MSRRKKKTPAGRSAPAMPSRSTIPERLLGAGCFSDTPDVYDVVTLITALKGVSWLCRAFLEATTPPAGSRGPDRCAGSFGLLFLAFVHSSDVEVERWWYHVRRDKRLFKACGLGGGEPPAYETVRKRFNELEERLEQIEAVIALLIQHLRTHDPLIGAWIHGDATSAASHSVPVHDCEPGTCPGGRLPKRPPRLSHEDADAHRQALGATPFDEDEVPCTVNTLTSQPISDRYPDPVRGGVRYKSGGHWWWAADPDAGGRVYTRNGRVSRGWFGFYYNEAIDHRTGLPLAIHVTGAHVNEASSYPDLLDRITDAVGATPVAFAGDRGVATDAVYKLNTTSGILSVIPWRKRHHSDPEHAPATGDYDEHGIPLCKFCGGGTDYERFAPEPSNGRIWFRCALPTTPDCHRVQTIRCSTAWRRLLPLPRTHDVYIELRRLHNNNEAAHNWIRTRYHAAGKDSHLRPKRLGLARQQLLADIAVLLGWLTYAYRGGYLGTPATFTPDPDDVRKRRETATAARTRFRDRLLDRRARLGRLGGGGGGRARYHPKLVPDAATVPRGSP